MYIYIKKTFQRKGQIIVRLMKKLDNLIVLHCRLNLIFFNVKKKRVKVAGTL